jgi:hypothetical protein
MTSLTPLRGQQPKDAAKTDPTPTNVAETVRASTQANPVLQPPDDEDDEDDEEDDDDDKEKSKAVKKPKKVKSSASPPQNDGRADERARIQMILDSDAGQMWLKADPNKLMNFVMSFDGSVENAIATLTMFPPPSTRTEGALRALMAAEPKHDIGVEVPTTMAADNPLRTVSDSHGNVVPANPSLLAAAIIAAGKKRRGEL